MPYGRGIHCPTTHLITYPSSLPFLKGWSLPCGSPLVRLSSLFLLDEPWRAYYSLGLIYVYIQANLLKNYYHCFQRYLHPDRNLSCYLSVICVEGDFMFPRRPPKTVMILLGSTDLLKGRPDYCIHYDVKICRGYRLSLRHPSAHAEGLPVVLPLLWNHPLSIPIPLQ